LPAAYGERRSAVGLTCDAGAAGHRRFRVCEGTLAEKVGSFFARIGETPEIEEFVLTDFLAQGDRVVVLVAGWQIYEDAARELAAHAA
jgi:hypothetical protein